MRRVGLAGRDGAGLDPCGALPEHPAHPLPFGAGLGFLYSVTTISGPPLAIMLNNQGLAKKDFRAALGIGRGDVLAAVIVPPDLVDKHRDVAVLRGLHDTRVPMLFALWMAVTRLRP